jgi:hypothetical protein
MNSPTSIKANEKLFEEIIYQGSPADFNSLSLDYIGSSQGSYSFGWGLYFTDDPEIAKYYARHNKKITPKGRMPEEITFEWKKGGSITYSYNDYLEDHQGICENKVIRYIFDTLYDSTEDFEGNELILGPSEIKREIKDELDMLDDSRYENYIQETKDIISVLRKAKRIIAKLPSPYCYQVKLPYKENITIYNGDIPLSEQTPVIQKKFQKMKQWMETTYEKEAEKFLASKKFPPQKMDLAYSVKEKSLKKIQDCFNNPALLYDPVKDELFDNTFPQPGTALHTYFALAYFWGVRGITGRAVYRYDTEALKTMSKIFTKFGLKGIKYKAGQVHGTNNPNAYNYVLYSVKGLKILKKDITPAE